MELSKDLKRILVTGAALLMTISVMGTGNVASAKHHRYYYRTHYVYRRHFRRRYRRDYKSCRHRIRNYARKRTHPRYVWMLFGGKNNSTVCKRLHVIKVRGDDYYTRTSPKSQTLISERWQLYFNKSKAIRAMKKSNKDELYKKHQAKRAKRHMSSNTNSIHKNVVQMQKEIVKDINKDRENNGKAPLTESPSLDHLTAIRAQQEKRVYGHIDPNTGRAYYTEYAKKLGIPLGYAGENLGESYLKTTIDNGNGTYSYFKNGKEMGDGIENGMMTNDASSDWGHRRNILGSHYTSVGVGTSYDSKNKLYYAAEVFND